MTRFQVDAEFLQRYPVQTVGGSLHQELWILAEDLPTFNDHIIGRIEVTAEFRASIATPNLAPTRRP